MDVLRRRLFEHEGNPWEGETIVLKVDLTEATKSWETLTEGGAPCPVAFDDADVRKTMALDATRRDADNSMQGAQNIIGSGSEGWVPRDHYERAMARTKKLKEDILAATRSVEERAEVEAHWPFDNRRREVRVMD